MSGIYADDRALVEALVANAPDAWELFVERYRPLVHGVARQTLRQCGADDPEALAGDVVGEVFAELLANDRRALTRFSAPWSLKGWLGIIACRRARRVLRRARREPDALEEPGHIAAGGRSPASEVGRIEDQGRVREHLEELIPRDRLALQLFYEGGHSYKEVAEILGLPAARVGMILARARARLARVLEAAAR